MSKTRLQARSKIAALTKENEALRVQVAAALKLLISSGDTLLFTAAALKRRIEKEAA